MGKSAPRGLSPDPDERLNIHAACRPVDAPVSRYTIDDALRDHERRVREHIRERERMNRLVVGAAVVVGCLIAGLAFVFWGGFVLAEHLWSVETFGTGAGF